MKNNSWAFALLALISAAIIPAGARDAAAGRESSVSWRQRVTDRIKASGAEVGLAFKDLETGETFFFQERLPMHAASTMKVPVMIEVFRQAEAGKLSLQDGIVVRNVFPSIMDGSGFSLSAGDDSEAGLYAREGESVAVRELVEKMITVSSNLATNLLMERVGIPAIQETLARLDATGMKVIRCLDDAKAYESGLNNTTDAEGLMKVMESIASGRAGSGTSCREMVDILSRQAFRENIPAGLPAGIRSGNKSGWITRIRHDAAIIFPEGRKPYVLVVLTRGFDDHSQAASLIAEISRIIFGHIMERESFVSFPPRAAGRDGARLPSFCLRRMRGSGF